MTPRSYILLRARLVYPNDGHQKVFAMLRVFLDDSGSHTNSKLCAVAGYFGGTLSWYCFERMWNKVLRRARIREFHAKDFWGRTETGEKVGPFKGWSDEKSEGLLNDLLSVIRRARVYPVGAGMVMKDWNVLTKPERRFLTGAQVLAGGKFRTQGAPTKAHFLPFEFCVQKTLVYCRHKERLHVSFDLDESANSLHGWTPIYFAHVKKLLLENTERLGSLSFDSSVDAPPLQAADLLAYRIREHAEARLVDPQAKQDAVLMRALSRKRSTDDFKLFNARAFDLLLDEFRNQVANGA